VGGAAILFFLISRSSGLMTWPIVLVATWV
jgi:hypothetical protein